MNNKKWIVVKAFASALVITVVKIHKAIKKIIE